MIEKNTSDSQVPSISTKKAVYYLKKHTVEKASCVLRFEFSSFRFQAKNFSEMKAAGGAYWTAFKGLSGNKPAFINIHYVTGPEQR